MFHIDLFSGIGGFALAADRVFRNVDHIFVDNDQFCQKVLRKHWPQAPIFSDIREFTADTYFARRKGQDVLQQGRFSNRGRREVDLLTGGFPCQPFSAAGKRKGTEDDRHLWPEMLRVIRETSPRWIVGENVRGFVSWNDGMVFDQAQIDLETEGYEVISFILPALAVNAPHRRDRVWIVASDTKRERYDGWSGGSSTNKSGVEKNEQAGKGARSSVTRCWEDNWLEVATELCGVDDGLPARVDGFELTKSAHRRERLKSLGNAIVPQVAEQIFRAIKKA